MARLELWTIVFAGVSGGLAGMLWNGLVTAPWLARGNPQPPSAEQQDTAAAMLAGAAVRAVSGALLGFLFWLGWGLIAVVNRPWYATGLLYGALCWAALAAPVVGTWPLRRSGPRPPAVAHAVEWLFTCLAVGLLCAYAWHRYA
jgi:hypothetical protein